VGFALGHHFQYRVGRQQSVLQSVSVCVGGGAAFFTFASVLPTGIRGGMLGYFFTGLKGQTRMRTS